MISAFAIVFTFCNVVLSFHFAISKCELEYYKYDFTPGGGGTPIVA